MHNAIARKFDWSMKYSVEHKYGEVNDNYMAVITCHVPIDGEPKATVVGLSGLEILQCPEGIDDLIEARVNGAYHLMKLAYERAAPAAPTETGE